MAKQFDTDNLLKEIIYEPSAGLIGQNKLYEKLKKTYPEITKEEFSKLFEKQEVNQVFKPPRKVKNYHPLQATPHERWQIDLLEMQNKNPSLNKNYRFIFVCVDVFSRYTWCIPVKSKNEKDCLDAMKQILEKEAVMSPMQVDADRESSFLSKSFQKLMDKYGIEFHVSKLGDFQSKSIVESRNRIFRLLLEKYMYGYNTQVWYDALPKLVDNYNNTIHSGMSDTPYNLYHMKSDKKINERQEEFEEKTERADKTMPKFEVGDKVRILIKKSVFNKKIGPMYSKKVHKITKKSGSFYWLDDEHEETEYYKPYELQKIGDSENNPFEREVDEDKFDLEQHLKKTLPEMRKQKSPEKQKE